MKIARLTKDLFLQRLKEKGAITIDVRTPAEYEVGHIDDAINIDIYSDDFMEEISKLDKNLPYCLYCHSGVRSSQALAIMRKEGFTDIADLVGGYSSL
jgi:rhodanese-related sulfurtransferase